jgi:hypothetical protein
MKEQTAEAISSNHHRSSPHSPDEYIICPFNKAHVILRYRMPKHIVKCSQSFQGKAEEKPQLILCPYNAMHMIPKDKLKEHLENCEDFIANQDFSV